MDPVFELFGFRYPAGRGEKCHIVHVYILSAVRQFGIRNRAAVGREIFWIEAAAVGYLPAVLPRTAEQHERYATLGDTYGRPFLPYRLMPSVQRIGEHLAILLMVSVIDLLVERIGNHQYHNHAFKCFIGIRLVVLELYLFGITGD